MPEILITAPSVEPIDLESGDDADIADVDEATAVILDDDADDMTTEGAVG